MAAQVVAARVVEVLAPVAAVDLAAQVADTVAPAAVAGRAAVADMAVRAGVMARLAMLPARLAGTQEILAKSLGLGRLCKAAQVVTQEAYRL